GIPRVQRIGFSEATETRQRPFKAGGLFQMAVDMRPLTREELVGSLPRELECLARAPLGRLRTERPPLGAPPSSSHRSMDLALSFGVSGGLECLSAIIPCSGTVMMGRQRVDQSQLFYLFNLEDRVSRYGAHSGH